MEAGGFLTEARTMSPSSASYRSIETPRSQGSENFKSVASPKASLLSPILNEKAADVNSELNQEERLWYRKKIIGLHNQLENYKKNLRAMEGSNFLKKAKHDPALIDETRISEINDIYPIEVENHESDTPLDFFLNDGDSAGTFDSIDKIVDKRLGQDETSLTIEEAWKLGSAKFSQDNVKEGISYYTLAMKMMLSQGMAASTKIRNLTTQLVESEQQTKFFRRQSNTSKEIIRKIELSCGDEVNGLSSEIRRLCIKISSLENEKEQQSKQLLNFNTKLTKEQQDWSLRLDKMKNESEILLAEVSEKESQLSQARADVISLKKSRESEARCKEEVVSLKKINTVLELDIEVLKEEVQSLKKLEESKSRIDGSKLKALEAQIIRMQDEKIELHKEEGLFLSRIEEIEAEKGEISVLLSNTEEELKKAICRNVEFESEINKLRVNSKLQLDEETSSLRNKFIAVEQENTLLMNEITAFNAFKNKVDAELQDMAASSAQFETEIFDLTEENNKLLNKVEELQGQYDTLTDEKEQLCVLLREKENEASISEDFHKKNLESCTETMYAREKQVNELESKLRVIQKVNAEQNEKIRAFSLRDQTQEKLRQDFEESKRVIEKLNYSNQVLYDNLENFKVKYIRVVKEKALLEDEVNGLHQTNEESKKNYEKYNSNSSELKKEINGLRGAISSKDKRIGILQDQVQMYAHRLDELQGSRDSLAVHIQRLEVSFAETMQGQATLEDLNKIIEELRKENINISIAAQNQLDENKHAMQVTMEQITKELKSVKTQYQEVNSINKKLEEQVNQMVAETEALSEKNFVYEKNILTLTNEQKLTSSYYHKQDMECTEGIVALQLEVNLLKIMLRDNEETSNKVLERVVALQKRLQITLQEKQHLENEHSSLVRHYEEQVNLWKSKLERLESKMEENVPVSVEKLNEILVSSPDKWSNATEEMDQERKDDFTRDPKKRVSFQMSKDALEQKSTQEVFLLTKTDERGTLFKQLSFLSYKDENSPLLSFEKLYVKLKLIMGYLTAISLSSLCTALVLLIEEKSDSIEDQLLQCILPH